MTAPSISATVRVVAGLAVAGALALPTAAHADGWASVVDLSAPGQDARSFAVTVDAAGNATAVWSRSNGANYIVQARRIAADGILGATRDLSAPGQSAFEPDAAGDAAGNTVVVWDRSDGTNTIIQARRIDADGTLGPIHDLSAGGQSAFAPRIAIDATGKATAVWRRSNGTNTIIQARRIGADGTLGATQDLSAPGQQAFNPRVALDAAGNATAVWYRNNGANTIAQARRIAADGTLGATQDLSAPGQDAFDADVAVDPAGNATAVWGRFNGTNSVLQGRRIAPGGSLGPTEDLSASGQSISFEHGVAVDPAGNATPIWSRFDGSNDIVQVRRFGANGALGPIQDISGPGQDAGSPQIAFDPDGTAIAVWIRFDGANNIAQARRIAPDGALSATVDLSAPGRNAFDPRIAIDLSGNVTAIWNRDNGVNTIVQTRAFLRSPNCRGGTATVPYQGSVTIPLQCSGLRFTREVVGAPAHGTLGTVDQAAGTVSYTPAAGYSGPDQFTFKAVNPGGESATVLATIEVGAGPVGPPPPIIGPTTGRATAALFGRILRFKRGKATERARCDNVAGDQCALALLVRTGTSRRASAARTKRKRKPQTLARAAATIAGGQTAKITWRLTAAGRKALRRKRVTATLAGTSRNRAGETVTVTGRRTLVNAPGKKKRKR
jgi:hypothetical protein